MYRLLDLFCGAGGAAMGYHRAGFEVVGVDIAPQPHYPFEFHQADALEYGAAHGAEFDAIHASPPCQKYSGMRAITLSRFGKLPDHPDLIAGTRDMLVDTQRPYVIENVVHAPLHTQFTICGASLGLKNVSRHRLFESNVMIFGVPKCQCRKEKFTIGVYGERPDGRRVSYKKYRLCRIAASINEASKLMGIDWMDWQEIKLAIPPAYTEFIGKKLISVLER